MLWLRRAPQCTRHCQVVRHDCQHQETRVRFHKRPLRRCRVPCGAAATVCNSNERCVYRSLGGPAPLQRCRNATMELTERGPRMLCGTAARAACERIYGVYKAVTGSSDLRLHVKVLLRADGTACAPDAAGRCGQSGVHLGAVVGVLSGVLSRQSCGAQRSICSQQLFTTNHQHLDGCAGPQPDPGSLPLLPRPVLA